ncbi:carbohydrate porin [Gluconacetobacter diazotrophicus]|uniref:Putative carbohydrate-selective porin n=1 Tax=Gluconacetobacter diazotrophicus (strain ATCC 49037 / DSM 5601 / CCUG 37298 / CIP 103539 / LMG 7603 / PAl5) TaxID=272568 RepID=A9HGX0_GLUDA|nr:carbohydrate porin [Gluconacetobacter diazotrophicus]CAP55559.1 oprB; OrderedLocusNames=PA3186 [Gluconacetobacter diazotrophicus PA1 5]
MPVITLPLSPRCRAYVLAVLTAIAFWGTGLPSALAQSETSKSAFTPTDEAVSFPLGGAGQIPIGPLVTSLYGNPHLLGDWGGIQPWLMKRGIFVNVGVNEEFMGNITGGRTRDHVLAGQVAGEVDIDWRKLAGIPDFWTHMLVVNGHGNNFSHTLGDYVANPEQIYGARGNVVAHLVSLYADKSFLHDRIILSFGWMPTGSFFNFDYLACSFMNVAICGNFAPGKYVPGGRDWPSGNLGGIVRFRPTERTYIMAGAFGVTQAGYNGGISGWSWGQKMSGVSTQAELGWSPSFGRDDLLGHYKIGAYYDNSRYPNLYEDINGNSFQATGLPRRYESGQWSSWLMFDQMLVRNGKGVANGLIAIGGLGYAQGNIVAMRDHEWIGLLESGTPWNRPMDQAGIMFQNIDMSHTLRLQQQSSAALGVPFLSNQWGTVYGVQNWERVYEAFYSVHLLRATSLQFDFQYLQHPGATTTFGGAAVVGGQFTTNF